MKLKIDKDNHKILNITHKDLDGVGCSIVLGNVFNSKNIEYRSVKYSDIDYVLEFNTSFDKYDWVILTDVSPVKKPELINISEKIILLDHHDSANEYHNPEKNHIVIPDNCATVLVKKFCENYFKINLSYLDNFVNLVNDYDKWILNDPKSWELNELYFKYWDNKFRKRFFEGDINFNEEEKQHLNIRREYLNKLYSDLVIYKFDKINGCFFMEQEMINDLSHKLLNEEGYDYVFCKCPKNKSSISVRAKTDKIHLGHFLNELKMGGGHAKAAGIDIIKENNSEIDIEKVLSFIQDELYKRLIEKDLK